MKILVLNKRTVTTLLAILAIILVVSVFLVLYNKAEETFNTDVYYQGNVDDKIIAFACNVDWGNEYIPKMLELFEKENIKITYFVTGKWTEGNNDILKQIYDKGHEIGNHGYKHIDYDKLDYERNKEEIIKGHNAIKDVIKEDVKYFAPPSGAYNDSTVKAAKDLGYQVIMWSIDTIDWRKDSTKDIIVNRVTEKVHNSAIVLMHPTEETVKALPDIINFLFKKGYKIGTISDVIQNN
ncbi:polysaccharide deacetylase family protein [Tissierella sp. MSJ-40]|uniref:Polysaccharide deacetylase family protein n=1 Tax=Tissierella simiarum TaxID=2841534 RepID=A0ABS6E420_9FIRM|nr:polysaccharide deacetylase family protein [Tissierella simiarum]MBU5437657.1 polysaccharide deacetylase family protein [Tissierella simiarum]